MLFFVSSIAFLFMLAGAGLGLWSAREMRETVADQFNQQQLAVARHVSNLIERQMAFLKRSFSSGISPHRTSCNPMVCRRSFRIPFIGYWRAAFGG
jgi:hypothetical protein